MTTRRLTDRLVDLDSLTVLDRVAATGSLTGAADALGVTQQAVSARVRSLERAVGQRLVVRSTTGSVLTDAGRLLVDLGAPVLEAAGRLEAAARALAQNGGTLVVAASQTTAEMLVPQWVIRSGQRSPETAVRLVAGNSETVADLVRTGSAHLGFIETPAVPSDLASTTVHVDELAVVTAPGHPWAARGSVSAQDLAATALLVREPGSGTRATVDAWLAAAGRTPAEPAAVLESSAVIRAAARAGMAPAVLSLRTIQADLDAGLLVRVAVDGPAFTRPFTAVWTEPMTAAAAAFMATAASPVVGDGGRGDEVRRS